MKRNSTKKQAQQRYEFRESFGIPTTIPVQVVVAELARIERRYGAVAPAVVVQAARRPTAPLHPAFEWDDRKASEQFRLIQARNLVRAVHVIGADGEDRGCAFVHVTVEDSRAYHSIARVVSDANLFALAMRELRVKLDGAAKAVRDLEAAALGRPERPRLRRARGYAERAAGSLRPPTKERP